MASNPTVTLTLPAELAQWAYMLAHNCAVEYRGNWRTDHLIALISEIPAPGFALPDQE